MNADRCAVKMEAAAALAVARAGLVDELEGHLAELAMAGEDDDGAPVESVRLRLRLHRLHLENEAAAAAAAGGNARAPADHASLPAALQRAHVLLRPGAIFKGQICIPGLTQVEDDDMMQADEDAAPSDYTLEVVGQVTDGMGRSFLLAHHEAYEDKQACYIDLTLDDEAGAVAAAATEQPVCVQLSYSDAETLCSGTISMPPPVVGADANAAATIRGTVKQLAYGEDGFVLPSAVTHTFELEPAAPSHVVELRAAINLARQQLTCALANYLSLQVRVR